MNSARERSADRPRADANGRSDRRLAAGLVALALGLAVNSLLGPLVANVVEYPLSPTVVNQTIGLEVVSLLVVAPWAVASAALVLRGHRAGPAVAVAPAAYAAYMFVQYVVGPGYLSYPRVLPLHLGIFVLGGAVLARAWTRISVEDLPATSPRRDRGLAGALFLLAAFTLSRYGSAFRGVLAGGPIPEEAAADPAMYWSIVLLDLGVVVPVTLAAAVGLLRGATWARKALYGIVGWFALVPISVAAMAIVMLLADDPNAAAGDVLVLGVASLLFAGFAAWLYRPLFRGPDVD